VVMNSQKTKLKYQLEMSKIQEELEKERKLRQGSDKKIGELNLLVDELEIENDTLSEKCAEQKALISRLENGLSLAMNQLDLLNSESPTGNSLLSEDAPRNSSGTVEDDIFDDINEDSLNDPEMMDLLVEALMNNRKSMAVGDLGDLFQKMDS